MQNLAVMLRYRVSVIVALVMLLAGTQALAADGKVNINTASAEELQTLSGIGEVKAERIVAYRENNGPFERVEDLLNVTGIGQATLEAIRDSVTVGSSGTS